MIDMLGYGAIGFSCALCGLAYKLLSKEQQLDRPRKNMVSSIYVFMFMSFMLSIIGFGFELSKEESKGKLIVEIKKIVARLVSEKTNLENIKLNDKADEYIIRSVVNSIKEIDDAIKEEKK